MTLELVTLELVTLELLSFRITVVWISVAVAIFKTLMKSVPEIFGPKIQFRRKIKTSPTFMTVGANLETTNLLR